MPEAPKAGLRLSVYARVSTEEQREGQTIDSQVTELERFANEKRWEVIGIYKDEGWSGGVMARPALDRLRDDASKGLFDAVVINDVDRLARDVAHLGVIKRDLEHKGIQVIFRKLPSENSPTHNLMVNILGSFAEFERELIADRTRRGKRHKVEVKRQFIGSVAPYGFRYTRKDASAGKEGVLEVVPEEAAVVRQMYRWVAEEGLSGMKVVKRLNTSGIYPRKGAKIWGRTTVFRILRSETYAGVWHFNKNESYEDALKGKYRKHAKNARRRRAKSEWIPLRLPPSHQIIERTLWERVQKQLDANIVFSPRNSKHIYLLSGLVKCGACRAAYVGDPSHGRFYYRCSRRCKQYPTISEPVLNDMVWESVREIILNPELVIEQTALRQQMEVQAKADATIQSREIKANLEKIEVEESRILEAYRTGIITPAQLGRELEHLKQRRNMLQTRLIELSQNAEIPINEVRELVGDFCRPIAERIDSLDQEEKRQLLRALITKVVFKGDQAIIQGKIPHQPVASSAAGSQGPFVAEITPAYCPMFMRRIVTR